MKTLLSKFAALIITLFLVSALAFFAFALIPADPATTMLGSEATPEAVAALRAELGLDRPLPVRYFEWLTGFLRGDLGESYLYRMEVGQMLSGKIAVSALLTMLSFLLTVALSIPLGVLAGSVRNRYLDAAAVGLNQLVMSVPPFFLGILACYGLGILLKWFTPGAYVSPEKDFWGCVRYLIFPALSIAIPRSAMAVKLLRSAIRDQLGQDYVRTARSRGASETSILLRQVLRNALLPVITFLAVSLAEIMTMSILIEQVFSIPGVGQLLLSSVSNRDYPVVLAIVMLLAAWIVTIHFLADLLTRLADPRVRLG